MNLDDIFDGKVPAPEAEPAASAAPEPTGDPQATADAAPEGSAEPQAEGEGAPPAPDGGTVPVGALQAERRERQDWKERAIREEEQRKALERELAQLRAQPPQPAATAQPEPPPQRATPPDPVMDPEGFARHWEEQRMHDRFAMSELLVRQQHPDAEDVIKAAMEQIKANPALAAPLKTAHHPIQALYDMGKKALAMKDIGDDPAAFEAKLREKLRAEILAEQQQAAAPEQPGAPAVTLPPSLAGMRSAAPRGSTPFTGPTPLKELFPA
jgi:hypothetical protein